MRDKSRIFKVAMILGMAMCISGCGSTADTDPAADQSSDVQTQNVGNEDGSGEAEGNGIETPEADPAKNTGYVFDAAGVTVSVDMDMDELAAQLGESKSIFEAPSCAGEGISYIYNYTSYEIETYPAADGKNRIGFIILKDDTVTTSEGVDLSMTKDDVIRVYGEDYEETGSQLTYEKDGTKLNFIYEGDNIISIEYVSAVIG